MDFRKLYYSLADLLLPRMCNGCGCRLALGEELVCTKCMLTMPVEHKHDWRYNWHANDWAGHEGLAGVGAYTRYTHDGIAAHIIHNLKYYRHTALGPWMGRLAAQQLRATGLFDGAEAIVPLPLAPQRYRRRGFNQSELIAQGMAEVLQLPIVTTLLRRTGAFESQTHFSYAQRLENAREAFALNPDVHPDEYAGRHFILVDDVMTTGATMLSAITAIEQIPDARFTAFCWAWVYKS